MLLRRSLRLDSCPQRAIEALLQAVGAIEVAIQQLFADHAHLARQLKFLVSVPAIGQMSAPHLLTVFHRFDAKTQGSGTAKQLVAFVGLDPQLLESGFSIRQRPTISRHGDAPIRSRLYLCALGVCG